MFKEFKKEKVFEILFLKLFNDVFTKRRNEEKGQLSKIASRIHCISEHRSICNLCTLPTHLSLNEYAYICFPCLKILSVSAVTSKFDPFNLLHARTEELIHCPALFLSTTVLFRPGSGRIPPRVHIFILAAPYNNIKNIQYSSA